MSEIIPISNVVHVFGEEIELPNNDDIKDKDLDRIREVELELLQSKKDSIVRKNDFLRRIYLWYMDGWTPVRVKEELITEYGKSESEANSLINACNRNYGKIAKEDMNEARGRYIEMYGDLYRRALEKKDYATARNILDSVIKLQGLLVNKVEAKVENIYTIEF